MGYQFESLSPQELDTRATEVKKDGGGGCYDPQWIREALVASSERSAGLYDEYLNANFQEYWAEEDWKEELESDEDEPGDSKPHDLDAVNGYDGNNSPKPRFSSSDSQNAQAQAQVQEKSKSRVQSSGAVITSNDEQYSSWLRPTFASLKTDDGASETQTTTPPSDVVAEVLSGTPPSTTPQHIITAQDFSNVHREAEEAKVSSSLTVNYLANSVQVRDGNADQDHTMDEHSESHSVSTAQTQDQNTDQDQTMDELSENHSS
jgi:hypothetical protein